MRTIETSLEVGGSGTSNKYDSALFSTISPLVQRYILCTRQLRTLQDSRVGGLHGYGLHDGDGTGSGHGFLHVCLSVVRSNSGRGSEGGSRGASLRALLFTSLIG